MDLSVDVPGQDDHLPAGVLHHGPALRVQGSHLQAQAHLHLRILSASLVGQMYKLSKASYIKMITKVLCD
jgi:hypothetical protein